MASFNLENNNNNNNFNFNFNTNNYNVYYIIDDVNASQQQQQHLQEGSSPQGAFPFSSSPLSYLSCSW